MSLGIMIKYKSPKRVDYNATHAVCGSNVVICNAGKVLEGMEWEANITHNLAEMARRCRNKEYNGTLCDYVWHPEKHGNITTTPMSRILVSGIAYMVANRKELLLYNSANDWGAYDAFLLWLTKYKEACEDNPGWKIIAEV